VNSAELSHRPSEKPRDLAGTENRDGGTHLAATLTMTRRSRAAAFASRVAKCDQPFRSLTLFLSTLLSSLPALGCGGGIVPCGKPLVDMQVVQCQQEGSVHATASNGFTLPATTKISSGQSCLEIDGTCTGSPTFFFQSELAADHQFSVGVQLQPSDGPGTYVLPDSRAIPINVYGSLRRPGDVATLRLLSGTLVVTRSDRDTLSASFDLELETEDAQQQISLSGGQVKVSGCEVVTVPTCVLGS
jgi:hypothetical protein